MPRTRRAMEKQWNANGLDMPDLVFANNIHSIEEAELQILMDEKAAILVPRYTKAFASKYTLYLPLKEKLHFSLYVVTSRRNLKPETSSLTAALLDNRIALNY